MNDYEAFLDVKIRKIYFRFWVMLFGFANKKLGNKKSVLCLEEEKWNVAGKIIEYF